ncbi:hypothetical protein [Brevibacillus daliensis]|uniref:hypothetical protein n=1 Tax=Brevibacillus daliensis TaxID=2892995 RepID=UPI001E592904|nr:hypothetical protein [Brevibacillus daliensis]
MTDTYAALLGLIGGLVIGLSGMYAGNKLAKKKRGLDERHHMIRTKARATSWIITLATLYILFLAVIFKANISVAAAMGTLLLVQMGSWFILVFYYQTKY